MRYILFIFLTLFCSSGLLAQETTSEIQGIITDNNNAPLEGATVQAIHLPTGTVYTTTSRKGGRYNITNMRVGGPYTLTVSFVGYETEEQKGITLLLGQVFSSNFELRSKGQVLDQVVITANSSDRTFNNGHTGSQEIVNRTQLERLPTVQRSFQDFTRLTPSANSQSTISSSPSQSIGGRSGSYNNITVDGADFNNSFGLAGTLGGQTSSQPISLDAIEQIQVNISPYDVRQGGFSGAGVNAVTRSGTNTFKGSVYTYLRGPDLQGYNVHNNKIPKPSFTYNTRGVTIGGPIVKDKLFFFISGEQERITQPATTLVAVKPGQNAVPGVSSQAETDVLDGLKDFLITNYKYDPGVYQNYNYRTQSDKITTRLDWNVNSKNTFTLKYNFLKSLRDIVPSNSGAIGSRQPSNFGLPFSGAGYTIHNDFNILIGELNTRFNNRISNKLQIGYSALRDFRSSLASGDFPLVDILNGSGQTYTSFGYEPFTYNNKVSTNIFQISDILTYFAGNHELTFGTQNYIKNFVNGFAPNYEGLYVYNTIDDFYNSAKNGDANTRVYSLSYALTKDGSFPFAKIGSTELGVFVQDKWRLKTNFTLVAGVRADAPVFKNTFTMNPNVPNLTFRDGMHYNVGEKPKTNVLISPRVGFNWDVFKDRKTQVRGGIGSFAGAPPFVYISNQASNNGVMFGSFRNTINPATGKPYVFSPDINTYRPQSTSANTSYNLAFVDHDFKYPQVLKTSLGVDQKLPGDFIFTAEMVYNKDIHAINFENVNLPSTGTPLAGPDDRIRFSSSRINSGAGGATPTNPNITDAILMKNYSKGHSYILTFQLQKSFKNFFGSVAYTHGVSKSINDGGSIAQGNWRDRPTQGDPNSPALGFSNFYMPNRLIAQASYRIEYAKHFATSIGFIYEIAPAGVASYTYIGDLDNDGSGGNNNLIYIPKTKDDIVLVPVNTGGGAITDIRTPDQIWNQLDSYIRQDSYLNKHRGEIADRNGAVLPYFKHLDLNITQDIYMKMGNSKHTIRLTFDIINLGNLLNKNWGIAETWAPSFNTSQNAASFLKFEGIVTDPSSSHVGWPMFSFPYQDAANGKPFTKSYQDNPSIFSRWQGQFGIRYLFN